MPELTPEQVYHLGGLLITLAVCLGFLIVSVRHWKHPRSGRSTDVMGYVGGGRPGTNHGGR